MKTIRNYEYQNMQGAYSDIETRQVIVLVEVNAHGYDCPCYQEIEQEEFTKKIAEETQQFC